MTAEQPICTFYLDGRLYGIEVEKVQEVVRHQTMTRVPLAPKLIGGLINLRGQIVTAIELRQRVGLGERTPGQLPTNVVVKLEDGVISLLVDEIGEVVGVSGASFEAAPETLSGEARGLIGGVYKLPGRLLRLLRVEGLVEMPGLQGAANQCSSE